MDAVVTVAVDLVNVSTPGEARGRTYDVPTGDDLYDALPRALGHTSHNSRPSHTSRHDAPLERDELDGFVTLAHQLRAVFEAVEYGEVDTAAAAVNELLNRSDARPQLTRHDGEPWHLHFHGSGSLVSNWTASCATGLAVVLGGEYADRLGVCSALGCDRVYVDTSRNGTRRFCSTTCQSRVKAAAYRRRQHA